jgi:hypothetical protein
MKMNKLVLFAILAVVLFVLTYDPKSGTLEKYLKPYSPDDNKKQCQDEAFRAKNPGQCKDVNYDAIQFASTAFMNPMPTNSKMGAIIRP